MPDEDINPRTAAAKKFDLSKKVGPFPLYVWVASGVALLAGAYFLWKKHTASSTAATTPAATTTATGTTTAGTGATGTGYQQYWPTTPVSTTPASTALPVNGQGGAYTPIVGGFTAVQAASNAGLTIYYQPEPGLWAVVPPAEIYQGSGYSPTYLWVPTPTGTPVSGGSGGGRSEARPLSVLGHMIRNGARGTA
jgi:cytoskeletal protein RodZ